MTTVKELIEELQKYDQDAIVLYAYDENGDTGVHDFIDGNFIVALDEDGNIMLDEQGELFEIFNTECDMPDGLQQLELIEKREGILKPAIKLFSR
jgi:hypothetical protein